MKKRLGKRTKMVYIEGNHETRLQHYLWRNAEMYGFEGLKLSNLLELEHRKIDFVGTQPDYWKTDSGHYKVADIIVTHGDSRLNGATCSKWNGYSASNTIRTMQQGVAIGHTHRLAHVMHRSPSETYHGLETGSLCNHSGTANWNQGFVTFETKGKKSYNHRVHLIK